jgi:hypothetical protein
MLQVFDGFDQTASLLFRGCSGNLPDPFRSSSNVVYIVFESNPIHHGSKFLLEWLQVDRELKSMTVPPPTGG